MKFRRLSAPRAFLPKDPVRVFLSRDQLPVDPVAFKDVSIGRMGSKIAIAAPPARSSAALLATVFALTLSGATGCGGKDKDTTPAMPGYNPGTAGVNGGGGNEFGEGPGGGLPVAGQPQGATEFVSTLPPGEHPPGLDLDPNEKQVRLSGHLSRAKQALASGGRDTSLAIQEAQAALQVDETSAPAMLLLAEANYKKGNLELAEDILGKAKARGGDQSKELHFLYGLIYERTDRETEALASFEKAVTLDPNYQSGLLNLGVHFLKNKRYTEAASLFERLTGPLGYNGPEAWNNLASAYRGRSAEFAATDINRRNEFILRAEQTYKQALSISRNYAPPYYNLGLLYLDSEPFPTANGDMDKMVRLKRAESYFSEYRGKPKANSKLAGEQIALANRLYDREDKVRKKLKDAERRRQEAEKRAKEFENSDSDEGFE